jgi:hypothetical protein
MPLHPPLPPDQLLAISRRLKIPLKHVTEYARFLRGHPTTKLERGTKRYINEQMSVPKFKALDKAVALDTTKGEF